MKTDILDKKCEPGLLNKIIHPIKPIKELNGRSKLIGSILFRINPGLLSLRMGIGTPFLLNEMI